VKPSAHAAFVAFSTPLEGILTWMYLDVLGYVTTGMGNLIDPIEMAMTLPWKRADGSPASSDEVQGAWQAVDACRTAPKGQRQPSGLATRYGGAFEHVTTIRLDRAGIDACRERQLASNEMIMRRYFPSFDDLPADAQLCLHSMAWAMGAGFAAKFVQFRSAINTGRYADAAPLSVFRGAGVQHRIDQDELLLRNAQVVADQGLDPDVLYWPKDLSAPKDADGDAAT
jgi:GH24 family phage-related lysozyme (muramidase)